MVLRLTKCGLVLFALLLYNTAEAQRLRRGPATGIPSIDLPQFFRLFYTLLKTRWNVFFLTRILRLLL